MMEPTNGGRGEDFETATATVTATETRRNYSKCSATPRVTITGHSINLDGTKVRIENVLGLGARFFDVTTFYAKIVDANNVDLYSDPFLTQTIDSSALAAYTSGGTLKHGGGYMDNLQSGKFVQVSGLKTKPRAGSNVEFDNQQNVFYKLVAVKNLLGGDAGPFTAQLQVSPDIPVAGAPLHQESAEVRLRYPTFNRHRLPRYWYW